MSTPWGAYSPIAVTPGTAEYKLLNHVPIHSWVHICGKQLAQGHEEIERVFPIRIKHLTHES